MKNKQPNQPARSKFSILHQICKLIPPHLASKIARKTGVDKKARTFSPWSHFVSVAYSQLTHSVSLNDVCDSLKLNSGRLSAIRGATPPTRNNLSNANKVRSYCFAEQMFYKTLEHLDNMQPAFTSGRRGRGRMRKVKRTIHVVDSTTIQLVASCMDWAKHRRRKAAAKCHLRLDLHSFLPRFAIVDTAKHADAKRAREVCAEIREGEIAIFDKAYVDFNHLCDLSVRGVFWVVRAKDNMSYRVVRRLQRRESGNIIRDDLVVLKNSKSRKEYPEKLRLVTAWVEVDGRWQEMVFMTNNVQWRPQTIADLYKCRWSIETFFKQIKQTLQLSDFLGYNANAVKFQIWVSLLVYVLLRYLSFVSSWSHSFSRILTVLRASLWRRWNLSSLLELYGTAKGSYRMLGKPEQAYLPGFT